ncbi:MAG: extracellular solute-binding protein, partial [Pisciglobus halotolerans]|nr:extracellular solute-binding protein [Pisciglobus halotolerans]
MKRLVILAGLIIAVCGGIVFINDRLNQAQGITSENTFNLYNWGDYIDPALLKKFEKESGYVVSYETFDSNEAMYTKVKQQGTNYDLAVPSEYMLERMRDENMLAQLDHQKIEGMSTIDKDFLDLPFDPNNRYSVPYFWGTLGIIYNDKFVEEGSIKNWDDLWKPDFVNNLLLIDGAREVMGLSLNSMGY